MNHLIKLSAFLLCLTFIGFAQIIDNVQFKDMDGKSYDLYNLLEYDKYVFLEMIWNG